jgi:osmotically-inducible protein OsmY
VVYLLGLVSSEEGDAAAEQVSFVPGIARVVKLFEYREPGV